MSEGHSSSRGGQRGSGELHHAGVWRTLQRLGFFSERDGKPLKRVLSRGVALFDIFYGVTLAAV